MPCSPVERQQQYIPRQRSTTTTTVTVTEMITIQRAGRGQHRACGEMLQVSGAAQPHPSAHRPSNSSPTLTGEAVEGGGGRPAAAVTVRRAGSQLHLTLGTPAEGAQGRLSAGGPSTHGRGTQRLTQLTGAGTSGTSRRGALGSRRCRSCRRIVCPGRLGRDSAPPHLWVTGDNAVPSALHTRSLRLIN